MHEVKHTCNEADPGKPLPFGRRDPRGECLRCKQLDDGAESRTWRGGAKAQNEDCRSRELTAHFASEKHRTGGCGPVCTFGDW